MALICMVMYATAAAHLALAVQYSFLNAAASTSLQAAAFQCAMELFGVANRGCDRGDATATASYTVPSCTATPLLIVNMILSDSIVLWRAWVLWSKRRLLTAVSTLLVLSTLTMSILNVRNICKAEPRTTEAEFTTDVYGLSAFVLSLLTNTWTTSLIAYKAWEHRQSVRKMFKDGSIGVRTAKILVLFVDSGLLYCGFWAILVAYIVIDEYYFIGPGNDFTIRSVKWYFVTRIRQVLGTVLVDVIGMYPTVLVLLVFLTDFTVEGATKIMGTTTTPIQPLETNRPCGVTLSSDVIDSTARVITRDSGCDPYTRSIIAILSDDGLERKDPTKSSNTEHTPCT
ncbi:uncharacterized protein PHACADRAFT_207861 [Phanerochaete carnosa HHB-10118-sp]|uniref:Uncharacterized protein n=1 Tax=Phanerochaete carnosa (strain HHB-10118-sp) TaxID=650164 RepID=K5WCC9_PHACS|nr:uncharacterized protein PHACADRAFT_207861 [Phanerochaete carnosa HHB-10118-sp]EKM56664.1 hypothetical protein PHACADRAFT_207861 [Phanerochaete carnosa HHB-10118-sp]